MMGFTIHPYQKEKKEEIYVKIIVDSGFTCLMCPESSMIFFRLNDRNAWLVKARQTLEVRWKSTACCNTITT